MAGIFAISFYTPRWHGKTAPTFPHPHYSSNVTRKSNSSLALININTSASTPGPNPISARVQHFLPSFRPLWAGGGGAQPLNLSS